MGSAGHKSHEGLHCRLSKPDPSAWVNQTTHGGKIMRFSRTAAASHEGARLRGRSRVGLDGRMRAPGQVAQKAISGKARDRFRPGYSLDGWQ